MISLASTAPSLAQAQEQLRRHGRSFFWAAHFLPRDKRHQAARLYSLCRQIDDIADNARTPAEKTQAAGQLQLLDNAIHKNASAQSPLADEALELCRDRPLSLRALSDLLTAVQGDLRPVQVACWSQLLNYCYGVAGTVGVMMAELLEVRHSHQAMLHAIDLGIAMQLTNMARDVMEDARLGRIYLPAEGAAGVVSSDALCQGNPRARKQAWRGVRELLVKADHYYHSGWQGLAFLTPRPRLAIAIAAQVYRDIGRVILRQGAGGYWQARARVSGGRKLVLTVETLWQLPSDPNAVRHDPRLHQAINTCLERPIRHNETQDPNP